MSCYKTEHPAVMSAWRYYQAQVQELREDAKVFVARWGADENYISQASASQGFRIHGFTFTPPKDKALWTVPDKQAMLVQRPRTKVTKVTPEQRLEHKALVSDWENTFPKRVVSLEPVLKALGLDWGRLMFTGYRLFEHAGHLWLKTEATPEGEALQEILGSEFDAAKAAYDKEQKSGHG